MLYPSPLWHNEKTRQRAVVGALIVALSSLLWKGYAPAPSHVAARTMFATITVTTTADENGTNAGACSLREAIIAANTNAAFGGCAAGTAGLDMIEFNVGAGNPTIAITSSELPAFTQPVSLDGATGGATRVVLDGNGLPNGLNLVNGSGGSTLRSLVIKRFTIGIRIFQSNGNTVQNCFLGTDEAGLTGGAATRNGTGLLVAFSNQTLIGGTTAGTGNVVSANTSGGIELNGDNLTPVTDTMLQGNFIGCDVNGALALGNGPGNGFGVRVSGAVNTRIGGATPGARNIIGGNNGNGIQVGGSNNTRIQGNYIGVNAAGTAALANNTDGIFTSTSANNLLIGGTASGEGNVIAGNGNTVIGGGGISLQTNGAIVQGNIIGLNAAATAKIPNINDGVALSDATNTLIGGTATGARNLIAGNNGSGVTIRSTGNGAGNNVVQGNLIGTNTVGTANLGNAGSGVFLSGLFTGNANTNTIGGTTTDAGNVIAFNNGAGVGIAINSNRNAIRGNAIFSNGNRGIVLDFNNFPFNDPGDGDAGANNRQNFPVLTGVARTLTGTTVRGTLDSTANTVFQLDFYTNAACDPSSHGEGQTYLGSTTVQTNASNLASFDLTLPSFVTPGQFVTATATDPNGNTSEFSMCACVFQFNPVAQAFTGNAANSSVTVMAGNTCAWTAIANVPWISITAGGSGSGNGSISYSVTANPVNTPRTGALTVAGNTFFVEQAAGGLIGGTDFTGGIPSDWSVVDGGTGGGNAATWTTADPCTRNIFPPPGNQYAIVDSSCAGPNAVQDEQLITPPFNVTGVGQVLLQFDNQFHWLAGGLNEVGEVDVSTDNGTSWQNVLRLQGSEDGFPTPNSKTVNITAACAANPANARVRFRYYTTSAPLPRAMRQTPARVRPNIPLSQELWWGIDRPTILGFTLSSTGQSFGGGGGIVAVDITAAPNAPWTVENLPNWITANPTSGTGSGTVQLTVAPHLAVGLRTGSPKIANNVFTVTQTGCPTITVNPASLPDGFLGLPYSQQLTQTGVSGAIIWSATGSLPNNLTLNATTGVLVGTPIVAGSFNFTVRATDANGCFGERSYTLTIGLCPTITINPASLPTGFVGRVYDQPLTQTGGSGAIIWSVSAGSLPGGLNLNPTSGTLTGTPTASGTFNFTVKATDANGCMGARSYGLLIGGNGLQFYPLASPVRLLDTRPGASPNACSQPNAQIARMTSRTQPARNFCTIPANAVALTGNVTTVDSGGAFLTLYPGDAALPTAASTNFNANEIVNNVFTVGLSASDGTFKIYAEQNADVVVDVTGYFAPPSASGLYFHPLPTPVRLFETRLGEAGCVTPGAVLLKDTDTFVQARTGCTGIPAAARAIVGNATTVNPQEGSYITLYPGNVARPFVATSNFYQGQTVNGPFTVGLAPTGEFKIYTTVTTDLVVDILGYYSTEALDTNGVGLLFTPLATPVRLLETRANPANLAGCFKPNAKLNAQQVYTQPARGVCQGQTIAANALAVVGNATVVFPALSTHMTFWPSSAAQPNAATSNYTQGSIVNRHFIVGLGNADGSFKLISYSTTDLVIDLTGYFAP